MIDLKLDWLQLYLLRKSTAEAKRKKDAIHTQLEIVQADFKAASTTHLSLAKEQQELEKKLFAEFTGIHKIRSTTGPRHYSPPKAVDKLHLPQSEAEIDQLLELILAGDFKKVAKALAQ
jgi:hypothetical protein